MPTSLPARSLLGLVGAFLLLPPASANAEDQPAPARIDIILLAGQSNADGRAPSSGLPPELRAPRPDILFYSHLHGEAANPDGSLGRLGPLITGRTQFPANAFGPEIGLGLTLAKAYAARPQAKFAIVKYAKGGSSLMRDWRAGGDASDLGDAPHYQTFKRVIRDASLALGTRYPNAAINFIGLVWVQGETDADTDPAAVAYADNLATFATDLRATLKTPQLRFVVARLSGNQLALCAPGAKSRARFQTVRNAQDQFTSTDSRNVIVDTDSAGFSFLPDHLHYDSTGQLKLGLGCADAIVSSLPETH